MATNPRVSDFENYLNSSFGAYPYNSLEQASQAMGPGAQRAPQYRTPLSMLGGGTPAPRPAKLSVPNPNQARAVGAQPSPSPSPNGPQASGLMPFQLVQSTTSNAPGAGLNFGSMGTSAAPTAESAANEISNAPVAQANSLLRQAQTPVAPYSPPAPAAASAAPKPKLASPARPASPLARIGGGGARLM